MQEAGKWKVESREVFSFWVFHLMRDLGASREKRAGLLDHRRLMNNKKQPALDGDACDITRHFVADAARFFGIQRFVLKRPFESGCDNARDFASPGDQ
jgi:hypothetical protein